MSVGRRGLMLSVAFLVPAVWLCPTKRVQAQPIQFQPVQPNFRPNDPGPGRHSVWQSQLSPEQIRALLARFGQDDGKTDWFEELLRKSVKERNPNANDAEVDATIKKLLANKEFMNRAMDLAQKHKNEMPDNGGNNKLPKWTPEDREKLAQALKKAGGNGRPPFEPNGRPPMGDPPFGGPKADPFKIPPPQADPNKFPPFDPQNPQFDPKRFPAIDPDNPPKFDPKTKFPLDPDTGKPFDPRNGRPIDPKNPPKIEPPPQPKVPPDNPNVMPKFDPPRPPDQALPKIDPKTGLPTDPDGKRKFDPENPLGTPNESPEKVAKTKAVEAATALWEKNVGPIEESPAVKRAIIDLVSDNDAMDLFKDGKGNNFFDALQKGDNGGEGLDGLFNDGGDSKWEWPKFDLGWTRGRDTDFDIGESRRRERDWPSRDYSSRSSRSGSSSLDGLGSFNFGGMQVPWLLMLILFAIITAAVLWWKWGTIFQPQSAVVTAGGPGPWPIDPHEINTREDVVKAFEFLSVLICGPEAKTWTHSTIADELSSLVATHGETAVKLARLYELARYAPLDEPLTRAELLEARRLVCDLAGIDA
jgi:hypothetical protein